MTDWMSSESVIKCDRNTHTLVTRPLIAVFPVPSEHTMMFFDMAPPAGRALGAAQGQKAVRGDQPVDQPPPAFAAVTAGTSEMRLAPMARASSVPTVE
jgi:hypothetical protein